MQPIYKTDTLAYQLRQRPALQHRDMSFIHLPSVVGALLEFESNTTVGEFVGLHHPEPIKDSPEHDAVMFYMLNHAVSLVRTRISEYEPIGEYTPIVEKYHEQLALRSARMFFYLLLICTRESRHIRQEPDSALMTNLRKEYGDDILNFHHRIWRTGSETAVKELRETPPTASIGKYTNFLVDVFYKGTYSGGYGGPAWGGIANVLRDYVNGTLTAEMMMDTAFTLCHNNGPIFNKGMLYHHYTDEISVILDVQRSGQIPQLIGNDETPAATNQTIKDTWTLCRDVLGSEFEGYVDWYKVEMLGALKSYPSKKMAQVKMYGPPPSVAEEQKKQEEAAKQKKAEEELLKKSWVHITPSLQVMKVEKKR